MQKGEPLFELDTDKVTQEVEAEASGVLLRIAVPEGEVPVGGTVAFIGEQGEDVPRGERHAGRSAETAAAPSAVQARPSARRPSRRRSPSRRAERRTAAIKASPLARRIARERGIELASLRGTGPDGRIVAEDVERAGAAPARPSSAAEAPAGEVERVPLSNIRKTIARRLTEAWTVPVFQLHGVRGHDARERARRAAARARTRRPRHRDRRPDEGLRRGADAPPRGERGVHGGRDPRSTRARTSASPSRRRRGSSCRWSGAPSGSRSREIAAGPRRPRRPRAGEQAARRRPRGRHVHDLEPRHVRASRVHRRAQPAAGRDRRGRRDRGAAVVRAAASSSSGRC